MKKIILAIATLVLSAGFLSAQDMAQATELYNKGAEAVTSENWTAALENFQKAMEMGKTIGADADELVKNCKNYIPEVSRQVAIGLINDSKYDEALTKIDETMKIATEYGNNDVAAKAKQLIPDIYKRKGAAAVEIKDYAAAADAYTQAFAADTTDGKTAIVLGKLLGATGNTDKAIEVFQHAAWNGEEADAKEQIANIYVKDANSAFKEGKLAEAIKAADKANGIAANPTACLIAGQASQKLKKNSDAIDYFEKYLQLKPTAPNASAITFTIAALYQGQKNNAKALEYYKKVAGDPKFGAQAKQMIASLNK